MINYENSKREANYFRIKGTGQVPRQNKVPQKGIQPMAGLRKIHSTFFLGGEGRGAARLEF